ncbi:MAG: hypothetical protein HY821_07410 [Acidobacteria bacterium]|nr:hypothetical protein [Acidobacteriota bacterium]
MNRRSTIALLAAAALLPACRREPTNARVDAAIAPLLPSETQALAGLRLDRLKNTKFFTKYIQGRRIHALNEFKDNTGLDPVTDVWEVVWAYSPSHSVAFIRGKFGGEFGLEPRFNVPGIQRTAHKGYYILYKENRGVLFMNTGVAVAGALDDLKAVVDQRDQPGRTPPQALIDRVAALPACHAYAVTLNGSVLAPNLPRDGNAANLTRMASTLGLAYFHADLTSGLELRAQANYSDPAVARQAQDTLRGLLGILRLRTPTENTDLLRLYDGIRITNEKGAVDVSVSAPFDSLDRIFRSLPISSPPESHPPDSSSPRPH